MDIRQLTKSDLPSVAAIHIAAFPESALTKMGAETIRRYYLWQLEGPLDSLCIGAYRDCTLMGFCFAGVLGNYEVGFFRKNIFYLLLKLIIHPKLLLIDNIRGRIFYGLQVIKQYIKKKRKKNSALKPKNKKFGILSIAVHPQFQGYGVGKELMDFAETSARMKGFKSMRLTVHPDNQQAVHFYKLLGWEKKYIKETWEGYMEKEISQEE